MSAAAPIAVTGLNHHFGRGPMRKQILYDISTEIPSGEIVIVMGPSGSGKTTLLTIVGALRAAQDGSVLVLGEQLSGASPATLEKVRGQIGFIFQQHNLLEALTATQNVELGLRVGKRGNLGAARRKSRDMLAAVGLAERMDFKPEQLSGGQRQRVAIARALAAEPPMLLADEPTASLDKTSGREVVERMQYLAKQQGTTILLVTHDNRILDVADRVLYLEDGRISSFTDAVIANTQQMMHTLAQNKQKQPIDELIAELDEHGFHDMLEKITEDSRRFLNATALASDEALRSMLGQAMRAFTLRMAQLLDVERASLFLVDHDNASLVIQVSEDLPEKGEARIPIGSGIAGAVAASGQAIRVDDAYADSRFNPDFDRQTGFRTRAILCLPIRDRHDRVFAVAQLLNPRDGGPFNGADEATFTRFAKSIGVILESLREISGA